MFYEGVYLIGIVQSLTRFCMNLCQLLTVYAVIFIMVQMHE